MTPLTRGATEAPSREFYGRAMPGLVPEDRFVSASQLYGRSARRVNDLGWHIHAVPQEAPLATRMIVEAAMAFTDVIRAGELDRLKNCAADDCDNIVVDLSRNRSKRFCEGGCGNRENVRAYRDRQRG